MFHLLLNLVSLYQFKVLDLPDRKPQLDANYGEKDGTNRALVTQKLEGYRVGEILDVNCTSPRSKPPATLKWYINNELVRKNLELGLIF